MGVQFPDAHNRVMLGSANAVPAYVSPRDMMAYDSYVRYRNTQDVKEVRKFLGKVILGSATGLALGAVTVESIKHGGLKYGLKSCKDGIATTWKTLTGIRDPKPKVFLEMSAEKREKLLLEMSEPDRRRLCSEVVKEVFSSAESFKRHIRSASPEVRDLLKSNGLEGDLEKHLGKVTDEDLALLRKSGMVDLYARVVRRGYPADQYEVAGVQAAYERLMRK